MLMKRSPLRVLTVTLAASFPAWVAFGGCSSNSPKPAPEEFLNFCDLPTVCQDIVRACHPKDDTTNEQIHNCHETGHDIGTVAACAPIHDSCVQVCNAAPSLGTPDYLPTCTDGAASDGDAAKD